jgi:7,8-dihydroneopterin aldolase/epimerase/oxygenase
VTSIELAGLEIFGYHGVHEEERRQGQPFTFDVWLDLGAGPAEDTIGATVDYREVAALVREVSDVNRFHLLESLAQAVARALVERFPVQSARVRVRKPSVVLGDALDYAAVTCEVSAASSG